MISDITIDNNKVANGSANETVIGTLSAIDDNIEMTHTFDLIDDDNETFRLDGNSLVLRNSMNIDYVIKTTHEITVRAFDTDNNTYDKILTITIIDCVIYSISPSTSKVGTYPVVTITGQDFTTWGTPTVYINGNLVSINSYTDTEIKFVLTTNLEASVYTVTVVIDINE